MKTFYIVTGRIPYDDEDSTYIFEAGTLDEADELFRKRILEDGEPTEFEDGEPCIYINSYIRCRSQEPPEIEWSNP